ncbi:MAPK regulated corepressor interacting protein 2 isoform X2 [Anopheles cruzii]|uniref:MAPK regulated corepressor interacting protein 2 isoform X2 n=1 Tax=Anopheles cruzii TaxID=68878 RepID=UPI0022EC3228|nr:MAPK regulated corepressor interacting protein 2 isoform X2 [Anopheles cruzii]
MYTVSKGPSKLVAKTRRGIPQNYEKYELLRDLGRKTNGESELSVPRPVFQLSKKSAAAQYLRTQQRQQEQFEQEKLSPQHEELIKYINDSWNMVVASNPYDTPGSPDSTGSNCSLSSNSSTSSSVSSSSSTSTVYYNEPPSPLLVDFKPFDLENWWGKRIFNNITKSL